MVCVSGMSGLDRYGNRVRVKVVLEEAAGAQAMILEKGMIVLSTAVAGEPFIGLLGTCLLYTSPSPRD